jgi:hydroxymethylglutaryl-CoA reductase
LHKITIEERRNRLGRAVGVVPDEITTSLEAGGLDAVTADKFVENVIGTYSLPYGVALNVCVNGRDYVVPMVVEEPSVVAAASNAAKMIRAGGGFSAEVDPPLMAAQVQLTRVAHPRAAADRILSAKAELLALANTAVPGLVERGGGARDLAVRLLGTDGEAMLVVHVLVDCGNAMGANLVNSVAERVANRIAEIARGVMGLRILTNLCDSRCVRVHCRVPASALATDSLTGATVIDRIVNASRFAELDPYRAATHNKGIMNGIDAVVIATGNDWRAVEAGAHAFAARTGRYSPLAKWRRSADVLTGDLELPMALGTVGGTLRVHRGARLSLRLLDVSSSQELAVVAASIGLASNLAAIRALAAEGIQRGHMALHARSVALAAGAVGSEVEQVAMMIVEARDITHDGAEHVLSELRGPRDGAPPNNVPRNGLHTAVTKPVLPARFHASSTASPTSRLSARAMTHPPPPAPVSFAPSAPAARAASHMDSISGVDRSKPASRAWFTSSSFPSVRKSPVSIARFALRTTVWIASNVLRAVAGSSARRRATESTMALVLDKVPE